MAISPKSYSSSSCIGNLPDDLVLNILRRLGRISIYSCRDVCKRWLALISDNKSFKLDYYYTSNPFIAVLPNHGDHKSLEKRLLVSSPAALSSLCFLPSRAVGVLGFYQDLLLCTTTSSNLCYICSLITKDWVSIPSPPPQNLGIVQSGLVFHSSRGYRVVNVPVLVHDRGLNLDIFSSQTGEWTHVTVHPKGYLDPYSAPNLVRVSNVVAYGGRIFWCTISGIVVYDPYGYENCRFINKPSLMKPYHNSRTCFGVCRGSLRLCQLVSSQPVSSVAYPSSSRGPESLSLMVWKLSKECGTWNLEHYIDIHVEIFHSLPPLAFHPNNEDILYFLQSRDDVFSFNLRTKTMDKVLTQSHEFHPIVICNSTLPCNLLFNVVNFEKHIKSVTQETHDEPEDDHED